MDMRNFLNRLDIYYYNIVISKSLDQKAKALNKVINMLRYCRMTLDFVDYFYSHDHELLLNIINVLNKPSLILLTYDLEAIGKAIGIPDGSIIVGYNDLFHIEYLSPTQSTHSSCEWS